MEICKMLTISTAHISFDTMRHLQDDDTGVIAYPKELDGVRYGYVILADGSEEYLDEAPDDLRACIELALDNDCAWLVIDCDGEVLNELPVYNC